MFVDDGFTANRLVWALLIAMLALFAAFQPSDPIVIAPMTAILPALGVAALVALRLVGMSRNLPNLIVASDALLQMTLFTLAGILLSYALAARGGALWDQELAAWDAALGFEWGKLRALLDRSWSLTWLLTLAYHSLIPQMVLVILLLSATGQHDALRRLVLAAVTAGLAVILLSGLVPAMGNRFNPGDYRHLPPSVASLHAEVITELRTGTLRTIDLRNMMGIVTFPSYHAALGLLFIQSFRLVSRARTAGMVWAGLTIAATPINGGHYAVDVLAGLALAWAGMACSQTLIGRREARPWPTYARAQAS